MKKKKNIGIFSVNYGRNHWNENNLQTGGIGGAEIWAINLSNKLVQRGYNVFLFCDTENRHVSASGVIYVPLNEMKGVCDITDFYVFIISRDVSFFDICDVSAEKLFLMCHDPEILNNGRFLNEEDETYIDKFDRVFYQSEYQKTMLLTRYPSLQHTPMVKTFQAITHEDYTNDIPEKKNQMLWSSCAVRGAKTLIEKIFPKIREKVPDFEIFICGYQPSYDDCFNKEGIHFLGNISHDELVRIQKESKIWIYPNSGWDDEGRRNNETFCITAIENGIAENALICADWGCWHTTLEGYAGFESNGAANVFEDQFTPIGGRMDEFCDILANEAIKCLTNEEYRRMLADGAKNVSLKYTWDACADTFEREFKVEDKQKRDVKHLAIYYRISDSPRRAKGRPPFYSKVRSFANAIKVFNKNNEKIAIDWHLVCDNVSESTFNEISVYLPEWCEVEKISTGSGGYSFLHVLSRAISENDNQTLIYFLEEDYLHRNGSLEAVIDVANAGIADYITLYDHPDKYTEDSENPLVENGAEDTRVYCVNGVHWKETNSTTMTFFAFVETLKKHKQIIDKWVGYYPYDFDMFLNLKRTFDAVLISPIPSFSTHCEAKFLAPSIDWNLV